MPADENIGLDNIKSPNLCKLFDTEKTIPKHLLTALFGEMISLLGNGGNTVNFFHGNGRKGLAIIVPVVKTKVSFLEQARKKQWIEQMLEHMSGGADTDKEDSAQWLAYYIGKKHDASLTLACDELGTPLVQKLDEASAESMWSDANINITQQRILRRHLRFHFGKRLFIPEKKILHDEKYYQVPMSFGEYKYYKDDNRSQKPEKCPYWYRDAALVVTKELERLIDYNNNVDAINRFCFIAKEDMTIVAGADQGQGAWHSWLKISAMSGNKIREQMDKGNPFDPRQDFVGVLMGELLSKTHVG